MGYGLYHPVSYGYKTGIFTSNASQAIDYVMRREKDVPAELISEVKKAVADCYGMVDDMIDYLSRDKSNSKQDNQGNPLNADGTLKLERVKSVDELTDEDFEKPTRNVELPPIPENVDKAIGAEGKPVIIKKNIFEKNRDAHKFPFAESRSILKAALYSTELVGQTQPNKKPLHWVVIKIDEKSPLVVLEVNSTKDNVEIIGWYTLDERNLERIKRQAERNGGELVMLHPKGKVESLSTPHSDLPSENKVTKKNEKSNKAKQEEAKKRVSLPTHKDWTTYKRKDGTWVNVVGNPKDGYVVRYYGNDETAAKNKEQWSIGEASMPAEDLAMRMGEWTLDEPRLQLTEDGQKVTSGKSNKAKKGGSKGASAKEKASKETVSPSEKRFGDSAVPSDADANVRQKLETHKAAYKKAPNRTRGFISNISEDLGLEQHDASHYGTFTAKNGKTFTFRISNHNTDARTFDENGESEGISIVISSKGNKGIQSKGEAKAHVKEFFYSKKEIENAEGKPLVLIIESIEEMLDTGEYVDKTGLAKPDDTNTPKRTKENSKGVKEKSKKKGIAFNIDDPKTWEGKTFVTRKGARVKVTRVDFRPGHPKGFVTYFSPYWHIPFGLPAEEIRDMFEVGVIKGVEDTRLQRTDGGQKVTSEQAKAVTERLKALMPDTKVTTFKTQKEAEEYIAKQSGKADFFGGEEGTFAGATLPNGEVVLVEENMETDTSFHEFAHKLYNYAKTHTEAEALLKAIEKYIAEAPESIKLFVRERYGNLSEEAFMDEVFAWALSTQSKGKLSDFMRARGIEGVLDVAEAQSWYAQIWNAIKEIWNAIRGKFDGGKYADLSVFDAYNEMSAQEIGERLYDTMMGGKQLKEAEKIVSEATAKNSKAYGVRLQEESEEKEIIARAKADGTYMKAPNGKPTNLTERQWVQVRTKAFKKWFGDWELAAIAKAIKVLKAIPAKVHSMSRQELEAVYKKLPKVVKNGKNIAFYDSAFDKNYREDGLFAKAVPVLDQVLKGAVFAYSETDSRAGQQRPDGTTHKKHPNIESYDNYVGKVEIDGKEYYVRFTVANEKSQSGVHSQFVSNVELYDNTAKSLSGRDSSLPSRGTYDGIVDAKLANFLKEAKEAEENSSKVVDENGEPLVVYHGTDNFGFTAFNTTNPPKNKEFPQQMDFGSHFSVDRSWARDWYAKGYKGGLYYTFLNIKNPINIEDPFTYKGSMETILSEGYDGVVYFPETRSREMGGEVHIDKHPKAYIAFRPNQIKSATDNVGTFDANNDDIRFQFIGEKGAKAATSEGAVSARERTLRDIVIDLLRKIGIPVIADESVQAVLDEVNGKDVRLQASLSGLRKASDFILDFLHGNTKQKSSKLEIPQRANKLAERAVGHSIKSHTINANEIVHSKKRHGINGTANDADSIPLRDEDFALLPYIMACPDRVTKGTMASNGTESVRYEKNLSNGIVVPVFRNGTPIFNSFLK